MLHDAISLQVEKGVTLSITSINHGIVIAKNDAILYDDYNTQVEETKNLYRGSLYRQEHSYIGQLGMQKRSQAALSSRNNHMDRPIFRNTLSRFTRRPHRRLGNPKAVSRHKFSTTPRTDAHEKRTKEPSARRRVNPEPASEEGHVPSGRDTG